jgi:hypothetical protein
LASKNFIMEFLMSATVAGLVRSPPLHQEIGELLLEGPGTLPGECGQLVRGQVRFVEELLDPVQVLLLLTSESFLSERSASTDLPTSLRCSRQDIRGGY